MKDYNSQLVSIAEYIAFANDLLESLSPAIIRRKNADHPFNFVTL